MESLLGLYLDLEAFKNKFSYWDSWLRILLWATFFYAAHRSRPSDGHGSRTAFYFLGWLHQHAKRTTASRQNIIQERAIDAFLFPDLRTDLRHEEDVCQRNKSGQSTEQATVSDRLGVLASRVAMTEVGNETCATIIKTTEQSVRPLSCHGESNWIKFSEKRSLRYRSWTDEWTEL